MEPQDLDAQIAQELEDRGYEVTPEAIQKIKSRLSGQTSPGRRVQRLTPPPPPPPPAEEATAPPAAPQDEGFGEKFGDAVDALQGGFAQITGSGFRAADTAARKLGATFAGVPYEQVKRGVGGYGGAFADAAEYFREVEEANRLSEADEENYVNQVARGIGQAAGFSVAGIAGGPSIGGAVAMGGYGAATQSNDAYWRILDKTKDEEKAWQGASLNAIAGASESFGAFIPGARALGSILFRMDKSTGGALKKALLPSMAGGMLKGGLAEAGQEMFQGSAEIAIDRYLDVYPEDRRTIMQVAKDVYETQGAPAFGVGAVLAPLGIAAERADMRARERANRGERVERPEAPEREMSPESTSFFEQLKRRGARRVVETPDEFKPQEEAARRRGLRLYAIETDPDTAIAGVERSGSGDIFININRRDEAVRGAIDHEVDHKLEVMDPEGYATKAKIIEETEPELLQQKMLEVKERYAREGVELSDDNAKREAIALLMETEVFPFTEAFRSDPKLVEEFLTDDRGAFKKVLEATMDVMNEMGAGFDTRRARLGNLLERVNAIEGRIKPESAARIAQEYVRSMQTLETLETGRAEAEQAAQRKAAEDRARARAEARATAAAGREAAPTAAAAPETPVVPGAPKALPAAPEPTPTDLISSDEAASLLGLSPSELVGLRDDGVLRSRGTDEEGRMVFSKAEVEAAMSAIGTEVPTEPVTTPVAESLEPSPEPTVTEPTVTEPAPSAVASDVITQRLGTLVEDRKRRYESAKADLDAIGPRPTKPSSEKKRFGGQGREGASAEDVQRYDAEVKAYQSWNRKYLRLTKAEVNAANEFFYAQQALESRKRVVAKAANRSASKPKLQLVTTTKPSVEISEVNPRAPLQPNVAYFRVINERGQLTATLGAEYDGTPQDLMLVMDRLDEEVSRSFPSQSEFYNSASQRLATDASGKLKWVVSPNLQNLSEISTESAAWTLGIQQTEPSQIQKETNAPQVRPQQPGGVVERPQAPQGGLPAEASGGNRPVEGQAPEARFSLGARNITQRDRAYLSAVSAGDMKTAQRMVDKAAKAAGWLAVRVYHGLASGKLEGNAFDPQLLGSNTGSEDAREGFYFAASRSTAMGYAKKPIMEKAEDTLREFAKLVKSDEKWSRFQLDSRLPVALFQVDDPREVVQEGFGVVSRHLDAERNKAIYNEVGSWQRDALAKVDEQRAALKAAMDSFESLYSERGGRDAEIVEAFIRMRNPYVIDAKGNYVKRLKIIRTAKKRGHDGVIVYDMVDAGARDDIYIAFTPNQIKSADTVTRDDAGNVIPLSQRFGESPDIRYSFTDAGIRQSAQDGIRFSFAPWREMSDWLDGTSWWPKGLEDFRNKYVDYLSTTKRLVSQAARKPAEMVPAMSRTIRRRGLAKTRIEQISDPLVRKFEKRAKELGVKIDDVADFMRARVAPLANARVDTVERRDPDAYYSGVTDAEALAIINRLKADPAYYKKLVEVVKIVDEMNELRLDIDVRSGRLKAEDAKAMRETYSPAALAAMDPTYKNEEGFKTLYGSLQSIPEKSVIDEGLVDTPGVGRGLGKSGAPAKARTGTKKGSNRQLANPVVNAMMALQAAVVREVKAQEQRSWRDFVASVGDPTFGVVMDTVPTKRVLGSDGYVHVIPDPNWSARPGVLPFLENGEWKAIVFKDDNRLIAEDLKALTVGAPIEGVAQITRGMSQLLTRYDPTFFLRNVPRDFGWAIMAGGVRYGYKFSRQMASNWPSATREIFRNKFRGAAATGYYKEYLESGAETSMIPFRDYNQSLRDLRKAVEGRDGTQFFQAYEKYIGGANDVFEAATRYAVFKTARLQGKTVEEAAIMAKEGAGLNFEQTGRYGRRINSLYAFFNAGINGTDQLLRLINPKNPDKEARVRAAQAVAAVVGVGIVQEILNRSFSDEGEDGEKEYDNISNFEKNRNMVFMLPEGGYLKAPLPFGFNAIYALGRNIAAYSMGAASAAEASTDAVTFFMESGSPLGSGPITQVLTPTMFEPIVQVATNQSFTGAKIAPDLDTFGRQLKAPHDLYWKNTPEAPKEIARLLAEATEKGDSGRGYIDVRPDIIEHIMAAYAGGIGQRAIEATDNLASLVKGDVPEARQTFGLRHFVGQASPYAIDKRYSDNRDEIEMIKARYEELVKEGDKETAKAWLDANGPLAKSYQALRGTERMLDQIPNTPENEERRRSVKARFTRTLSQLKASPQ